MIAITTSNSTSVNARSGRRRVADVEGTWPCMAIRVLFVMGNAIAADEGDPWE